MDCSLDLSPVSRCDSWWLAWRVVPLSLLGLEERRQDAMSLLM